MTDEITHRVAEIGAEFLPVILDLREFQDFRFLEIRMYERTEAGHAPKPTNRAIGLDAGTLSELKTLLDGSFDNIRSWLDNREWDFSERVRLDLETQSKANTSVSHQTHKIELRIVSWSGPNFFKARSEGELIVVELNANHPVAAALHTTESSSGILPLFCKMFAAYQTAKDRFSGPDYHRFIQTLDALEYEWGMILDQYERPER